jgi:nitroreductase
VTAEVKAQLFDAAIAAPTAGCMCLYTILDITDQAMKERLSVLCDNQPFIAKAPVVLVFLADWQRWHDSFVLTGGGQTRRPAEGDLLLAAADAIIAAQNVVVAAEALDLGSCYIGDVLEAQEEMAALLQIPPYAMPVAMLCIGYPTRQQQERPKPRRFDREYLVHENTYRLASAGQLRDMFDRRNEARGFDQEVPAMAARKWNSEFMAEMNRSVRAWLRRWGETD